MQTKKNKFHNITNHAYYCQENDQTRLRVLYNIPKSINRILKFSQIFRCVTRNLDCILCTCINTDYMLHVGILIFGLQRKFQAFNILGWITFFKLCIVIFHILQQYSPAFTTSQHQQSKKIVPSISFYLSAWAISQLNRQNENLVSQSDCWALTISTLSCYWKNMYAVGCCCCCLIVRFI